MMRSFYRLNKTLFRKSPDFPAAHSVRERTNQATAYSKAAS
jgi:hypothetical protein